MDQPSQEAFRHLFEMSREDGPEAAYDQWLLEQEHAGTPDPDHENRWLAIVVLAFARHHEFGHQADVIGLINARRDNYDLSDGEHAYAEWRYATCRWLSNPDSAAELFWAVRPIHEHLYRWAKARLVGPWGTFAGALVRAVSSTPPTLRLPPIIGSEASLNLFVALVGPPGAGKDAAVSVSYDAMANPMDAPREPLGSGEGISHMFSRRAKPSRDNPDPEVEQFRTRVIATVSEVDALAGVASRRGSTLSGQLRSAAMGEKLGFYYVDKTRNVPTGEHAYRLGMTIGIQPRRSGALLSGPEAEGGTPQRFLWINVGDGNPQEEAPEPPPTLRWRMPAIHDDNGRTTVYIDVCKEARDSIIARRVAALRGETDEDQAHEGLTRLKAAAALAILDGRLNIGDDDWHLAGALIRMSRSTMDMCRKELAAVASEANISMAHAEAARKSTMESLDDEEMISKARNAIIGALGKLGPLKAKELRVKASKDRKHARCHNLALERLTENGEVIFEPGPATGKDGQVVGGRVTGVYRLSTQTQG